MRVTSLGHAALYIETTDQRILVDPVLGDTLMGGALTYFPPRRLDLSKMPEPTALIVTHGHFDHYHPPSLERLRKDLVVITAEDPELVEGLRALGFSNVTAAPPWSAVDIGRTRIVPTPSGHDEPEFGVVISDGEGAFWHMADAEVSPSDGARVVREHGRIDVVSAKYQPVVRASMGHLRARGARFDAAEVVDWLETACAVDPGFVFPFASGLCFAGRHAWFNRYAFPLQAEEVAHLLQKRLGPARAGVLHPGDALEITAGASPRRIPQASPFVATDPQAPAVHWEPVDVSTLEGLGTQAERSELEARLDAFLAERLLPWLGREVGRRESPWRQHVSDAVIWQLVIEAGDGQRIERHLDYGAAPFEVRPGRHPYASAFTHVSGRTLLDVLRGNSPGLLFWLAGDARSYEKTITVEEHGFRARPLTRPEMETGDPLTYFLRHFGPSSEGRPTPTASTSEPAAGQPSDIEVLVRQGETRAVAEKKALLSLLSLRELEQQAVVLGEAATQGTSDEFRTRFGLEDPDATRAWLDEVGLDLESYTQVMRGFAAVRLVQTRLKDQIEPLVDAHAKVAMARRRDR